MKGHGNAAGMNVRLNREVGRFENAKKLDEDFEEERKCGAREEGVLGRTEREKERECVCVFVCVTGRGRTRGRGKQETRGSGQ